MKVAVLGSGAGTLAVAAGMSRVGRHTVMAEFDGERAGLEPVRATDTTIAIGKITMTAASTLTVTDGRGDEDADATRTYPVDVADSVAEILAGAELFAVMAPSDAR